MATKNKIIEMIATIKTIYPYYAKDTDVPTLVKTWSLLLSRYTDEVVEVAFFNALKACKVPPTPADVIERMNRMKEAVEPTPEELWHIYQKALKDVGREMSMFGYTYIDHTGLSQGDQARANVDNIWSGLPEVVKMYFGDKRELMRQASCYDDEDISFEKGRFLKTIPTLRQRQEYKELSLLVSGGNALLLE